MIGHQPNGPFIYARIAYVALYHTPALDTLRSTAVGRLTLGTGFDPRD